MAGDAIAAGPDRESSPGPQGGDARGRRQGTGDRKVRIRNGTPPGGERESGSSEPAVGGEVDEPQRRRLQQPPHRGGDAAQSRRQSSQTRGGDAGPPSPSERAPDERPDRRERLAAADALQA